MRELADTIGMSVGSIYHYVGSKQDILYLIINKAVTRPEGWTESISASLKTASATQVLKDFIRVDYIGIEVGHTLRCSHIRKPGTWTANRKKSLWMPLRKM